jgi:hypothetical protein
MREQVQKTRQGEFGIVLLRCLWRIESGELHICRPDGDARPRNWSTAKGSGNAVSVWRRAR